MWTRNDLTLFKARSLSGGPDSLGELARAATRGARVRGRTYRARDVGGVASAPEAVVGAR